MNVDTLEDLTIAQVFDTEAVTYSRLRQTSDYLSEEISSDEEEEDDYISEDDWESFESKESGLDGVKKNGETVVSKHDKELSQRKNAKRIMEFPPGLDIRDGGGGAQVRPGVVKLSHSHKLQSQHPGVDALPCWSRLDVLYLKFHFAGEQQGLQQGPQLQHA